MSYELLSEYFNSQYTGIFQNEAEPIPDRVSKILDLLDNTSTTLKKIIAERSLETEYHAQLTAAGNIQKACRNNSNRLKGRLYTLDLINTVRKDFDLIIKTSTDEIKNDWHSRLFQLENPSLLRKANDAAQYVLSTALSPLTFLNRALVPTQVQSRMNHLFDTFDSECKSRLFHLANSRFNEINNKINNIEQLITAVANNKSKVIQWIKAIPTDKLEDIRSRMETGKSLFIQFQESYDLLTILNRYTGLTREIDNVIHNYNTWFIRICVRISRFFSINTTKNARRIIELEEIKTEILTISYQMEAVLSEEKEWMNRASQGTSPLPATLDSLRNVTPTGLEVNNLETATTNITSFFQQLKASFQPGEAEVGVGLAPQ